MATNFPTSLDTLTNPTAGQGLNSPSHSGQHANVNDAVEALEAKVGITGSTNPATLDYRVNLLESGSGPGGGATRSPFNYGAFGDGAQHPLSEVYGSLAAAQAVYPRATALTEQIDRHAVQKAVDSWPKSSLVGGWKGGEVDLGFGVFWIDQPVEVDLYDGMMLLGHFQNTVYRCTSTMAGKPFFRFNNCRKSGVAQCKIVGNSSFAPLAGIESREDHQNEPAGIGQPATELIVRDVDIFCDSADGFVDGIIWTTTRRNQNNDLAAIRNVSVINHSRAAFHMTHQNSLLHNFDNCSANSSNASAVMFLTGLGATITFTNGVSAGGVTLTSTTAAFSAADVGAGISGPTIPANTTITTFNSATSIGVSNTIPAGSGLTFIIQPKGGGSFTASSCRSAVAGWVADFGAGTYEHTSVLRDLRSEPPSPGLGLRSNSGAVTLRVLVSGCDLKSAVSGSTKFIDWQAPASEIEVANSSMLANGGALDFGTSTTTLVALTNWKSNMGTLTWAGKLTDVNHTDFSGSMTDVPGATALLARAHVWDGTTSHFVKHEFKVGTAASGIIFYDSATGQMKVTDATSTRQI